ncbi:MULTISPECIES: glycosyltransferase [unclassified Nocardioides]|uniref:glycosyltransferase n=1 Tax=unclassified Nocardioides TaxID=2615069 RepID=UPI0036212B94
MRVTVVTISYRDLPGLVKTRQSVAAQTWRDIEHVVVDGGSGEETERFLVSLRGVQTMSEPDKGRYDAMNKGIAASNGDLVWFMHAGDAFGSARAVQQVVEAVSGLEGQAYWGYGIARKIDDRGECVGLFGDIPFSLRRFALGGHPIPHQAAFFSRAIIDKVGHYELDHGLAADQLFMLRCAALVSPRVLPEIVCDFDTGGAGSTRSIGAHFKDMRRARRAVGISATGSEVEDAFWSGVQQSIATAKRALGGRTR